MTRKKKILTIAGGLILIAVIGTGVYFGTRKTETNSTELAYVYRVSLMNPASQVQRMAGDRKSTRLNSSHRCTSRMPSSA